MKKCIYCGSELYDGAIVDVCQKCGVEVWGEKMFNTIKQNMENAMEKGDLYQGSVNENFENSVANSDLQKTYKA